MNHTLQVSDNMYAEAFQRTLGTLFVNVSGITDSAQYSGVAVIANQLVRAGRLDPDSFHQDDGSGLSRQNLVPIARHIHNNNYYYYCICYTNTPCQHHSFRHQFLPSDALLRR
jgi:hypothetical protein